MRHLMSPLDFSIEELDKLLELAQDIEAHPAKYEHACEGKKLATLFYEPSTRTRLSHEAAMLNLGGSVMGFSSADSSSAAKVLTITLQSISSKMKKSLKKECFVFQRKLEMSSDVRIQDASHLLNRD